MCDYECRDSDGDGEGGISVNPADSSSSSISSEESTTTTGSRPSFDLETTNSVVLKPHRSSESANAGMSWGRKALALRDFILMRRIGAGDIGTVFLCRMEHGGEYYAMKVVDKEALAAKKKVERSETERKILKMLDHPFLPTLYAEFEASHYSCIVMEYCPGGDLHSLRHKLPFRRFPLASARFYAAEVLVALEYLHMLGIIYRDLKPENVLVKVDGHIMLSDFDLSLCSDSILAVESPSSSPNCAFPPTNRRKSLPSLLNRLLLLRSRKVRTLAPSTSSTTFIAEPVTARSCSFVGTHEYVAPEVAGGGSHGNAVDWWALGVFLYELIYGCTPFAARSNHHTLRNIVKRPLTFPDRSSSELEHHARDLIAGLLIKDPATRLGSQRGAAEIKTHPFFGGLNFALIRTLKPPEIPGLRRQKTMPSYQGQRKSSAFDYF